jgi:hypothetical protein
MIGPCDVEALEALVSDALTPDQALAVQAHARTCPACGQELAWLRAERRLIGERKRTEPGLPPDLWRAVEGRIGAGAAPVKPPRGRFFARLALPVFTGAAALAAALLLTFRTPAVDPGAGAVALESTLPAASGVIPVLDAALAEYEQAISELEEDLRRSGGRLPAATAQELERRFGPTRRELTRARAGATEAETSPEARMRALDGYAEYVRSLQAAVLALEDSGR